MPASYDYRDERGSVLYTKVKYGPHRFGYLVNGARVAELPADLPNVPYRLPELVAGVRAGRRVWICEGEKDADTLAALGEVATTARDGAGGFPPGFFGWFAGAAQVFVCADRDEVGFRHARQAAAALAGVADSVAVLQAHPSIRLPGADVTDHVEAGFGLEEMGVVRDRGLVVVTASEVAPRRYSWLWHGYLPQGAMVMLDGDPGSAKSTMSLDLAARVSSGAPMPNGWTSGLGPRDVVILSAEDSVDATIRPRLEAAGADMARVHIVAELAEAEAPDGTQARKPVMLPRDLPFVEALVRERRAALLIFDPIMSFLDPRVDSYRDQDVRTALYPLKLLAEREGCCVLILRHLTKSSGGSAMYRGGGSIGLIGGARVGLMTGDDPGDDSPCREERRRVLAVVKCNVAPEAASLAFRTRDAPGEYEVAKIEWQGTSGCPASELVMHVDDETRTVTAECARWLEGYLLSHGGEAAHQDIAKAARANGYTGRSTLYRARTRVGVKAESQRSFPHHTIWCLDLSRGGADDSEGGGAGTIEEAVNRSTTPVYLSTGTIGTIREEESPIVPKVPVVGYLRESGTTAPCPAGAASPRRPRSRRCDARGCGAPARLYPCGARCEAHRPRRAQPPADAR